MIRFATVLVFVLLMTSMAMADDTDSTAKLREQINKLEKRIEELETILKQDRIGQPFRFKMKQDPSPYQNVPVPYCEPLEKPMPLDWPFHFTIAITKRFSSTH